MLTQEEVISKDLLPQAITSPVPHLATIASLALNDESSLAEILDAFERRVIIERLEQTGWSHTVAAGSFKVPLSTLNQKIKRHGIISKKKREKAALSNR